MSAALQPVNDKFPSPDEIANKHIKQLAEDLQYSDHCKLWIKGIYKESTGGDKATVKLDPSQMLP